MCVSDAAAWAADRAYGDTRLAIASHSTLQNLNDHLGAVQNGELRSRQFYVAKTHPASGKSRRRVLYCRSVIFMKNTSLCYIQRGDEYLMLHRVKKENDENRDKWIGIGGKFEPGESPEECMLREAFEETGLTISRWQYRGIVTFVSDEFGTEYMHLFTADRFQGQLKDCDEGELAWIKKAELLRLTMWEGDRIFLRLLDSGEPFFSLKLCYQGEKLVGAALNGKSL